MVKPSNRDKMTITRERFELALDQLKGSDWARFEALASRFLVPDYPHLRTMASPSGDGGRDAEFYHPDSEPTFVFQYSVQLAWEPKIKATLVRLAKTFPHVKSLTYVTNQTIGARGDKIKSEARKAGVFLDVLDKNWFLDRMTLGDGRAQAAEDLARAIVDPLLIDKNISSGPSAISNREAGTALVYLEMQRQDEVAGRNLTRSSFEALVRAALHGSNRDERVSREDIYKRVHAFLPQHDEHRLKPFVDAALTRLKKAAITEWGSDDTFHIRADEAERIKDASSRLLLKKLAFEKEVTDIVALSRDVAVSNLTDFLSAIREIVETYFLKRGEEFAAAVNRDSSPPMNDADIKQIAAQKIKSDIISGRESVSYAIYVVSSLLNSPSPAMLAYLKVLADSYTLFAFLSETPDVQSVTKKLFSHGEIWLDTSVLLPIFPETIFAPHSRPFSSMLDQARRAGVKLYMTPGVLEEVERHLNRSRQYARSNSWEGNVPYVCARYILGGGKKDKFSSWLENFMGTFSPEQDLADYLKKLGVFVEQPPEPDNLPRELRDAVFEYWRKVQDARRGGVEVYNLAVDRLARHDAENTLAVLAERAKQHGKSSLGYSSWWLTLDRYAFKMGQDIDRDVWLSVKHSPVLSLDFLLKYLTFGPARDQVHDSDQNISRIFSTQLTESLPAELLSMAEAVRTECDGLEEHIVQRRIRDKLNEAKLQLGEAHQGGLENVDAAINAML